MNYIQLKGRVTSMSHVELKHSPWVLWTNQKFSFSAWKTVRSLANQVIPQRHRNSYSMYLYQAPLTHYSLPAPEELKQEVSWWGFFSKAGHRWIVWIPPTTQLRWIEWILTSHSHWLVKNFQQACSTEVDHYGHTWIKFGQFSLNWTHFNPSMACLMLMTPPRS